MNKESRREYHRKYRRLNNYKIKEYERNYYPKRLISKFKKLCPGIAKDMEKAAMDKIFDDFIKSLKE